MLNNETVERLAETLEYISGSLATIADAITHKEVISAGLEEQIRGTCVEIALYCYENKTADAAKVIAEAIDRASGAWDE